MPGLYGNQFGIGQALSGAYDAYRRGIKDSQSDQGFEEGMLDAESQRRLREQQAKASAQTMSMQADYHADWKRQNEQARKDEEDAIARANESMGRSGGVGPFSLASGGSVREGISGTGRLSVKPGPAGSIGSRSGRSAAAPSMEPGIGPSNQYEAKAEAEGKEPIASYMNPDALTRWIGSENQPGQKQQIISRIQEAQQRIQAIREDQLLTPRQKAARYVEAQQEIRGLQGSLAQGEEEFHKTRYLQGTTHVADALRLGSLEGAAQIAQKYGMPEVISMLSGLSAEQTKDGWAYGRKNKAGKFVQIISPEQLHMLANKSLSAEKQGQYLTEIIKSEQGLKGHQLSKEATIGAAAIAANKLTDAQKNQKGMEDLDRKAKGLNSRLERLKSAGVQKDEKAEQRRLAEIKGLTDELDITKSSSYNLRMGSKIGEDEIKATSEKHKNEAAVRSDKSRRLALSNKLTEKLISTAANNPAFMKDVGGKKVPMTPTEIGLVARKLQEMGYADNEETMQPTEAHVDEAVKAVKAESAKQKPKIEVKNAGKWE